MSIPGTILGSWSHHRSAMASVQTHTSIRKALTNYKEWSPDIVFDNIFLQGSYKNNTNLHQDSDVDIVIQLSNRIRPRVAKLSGSRLERNPSHLAAFQRWQSFRNQTIKALRASFGTNSVSSGRKSLKIARGRLPAAADVVVTVHYEDGLAFFLPDEHRWVVSYPQRHYERGLRKEESTNNRFKRVIRMFKAARGYLVENNQIQVDTAPSYFIECLLYNVPNEMFRSRLVNSYVSVVEYLSTTNLRQFECQNGRGKLFGSSRDLWDINQAKKFILALEHMWEKWPKAT